MPTSKPISLNFYPKILSTHTFLLYTAEYWYIGLKMKRGKFGKYYRTGHHDSLFVLLPGFLRGINTFAFEATLSEVFLSPLSIGVYSERNKYALPEHFFLF